MYLIIADLRMDSKLCFNGVFLKQVHGFLFSLLQEGNEALARQLHDEKAKQQFSFSIYNGEFQLSTIDEEIVRCIYDGLKRTMCIRTRVENVRINDLELIEVPFIRFPKEKWVSSTITFQTPVTFNHHGAYYPLPDLMKMFFSVKDKYELLYESLDVDTCKTIEAKVFVGHVRIRNRFVEFNRYRINGFVGEIQFFVKRLNLDERVIFERLLQCFRLFGVGAKCAMGLGKTVYSIEN